jgi:hypothetical protein
MLRAQSALPPTLEGYLKNAAVQAVRVEAAFCFDSDFAIQSKILRCFPAGKVLFVSYPCSGVASLCGPKPSESFLVEIDAESVDFDRLTVDAPWILQAHVILIRATLGCFWAGRSDLNQIVRWWGDRQFRFVDTLEYVGLPLLNASLARVVLAFEKRGSGRPKVEYGRPRAENRGQVERCNEALTFLSRPIAEAADLIRLTGRGSFGFAAGVLNAGAIAQQDGIILLARGEQVPWAVAERNQAAYLADCRPVLIELNNQLAIAAVSELAPKSAEGLEGSRLEDFRLFRHRNMLFSNHARITNPGVDAGNPKPLEANSLRVSVGVSGLDLVRKEFTYLGTPKLDRPVGAIEKNWVCFEYQQELYLLYSFKPYLLLRALRWPALDFGTVLNQDLVLSLAEDRMPIRNSVNPVEYDDEHFLHVIHKVYPGKQYAFWGVLIEKQTLLPKWITDRPLVCGWRSAPAGIIYVSALIPRESEILVFGGIDDCSVAIWRVPRSRLDSHWSPLERC